MTTDIEQRLHTDMEAATSGLRVPPGLATKAYRAGRKHQAQRRLIAAAGTAAAVVAGVFTAAGASGLLGSSAPHYTTTSYVVTRVERALGAPSLSNMVGYARTTYPPGMDVEPVPGGMAGVNSGASTPISYMQTWAYHNRSRMSAYAASGQRVFDVAITGGATTVTTTAVNYGSSTWWTATSMKLTPGGQSCVQGDYIRLDGLNGWPAFIRVQLGCGAYSPTGRQEVDGVNAIRLSGDQGAITVWVNPGTYLPVRLVTIPPGQAGARSQIDFQWLSPTAAHLAQVDLGIPAGFSQVSPPAVMAPQPGR